MIECQRHPALRLSQKRLTKAQSQRVLWVVSVTVVPNVGRLLGLDEGPVVGVEVGSRVPGRCRVVEGVSVTTLPISHRSDGESCSETRGVGGKT